MTVRIVADEDVPEEAVLRGIQRLHGHTHPRREGGLRKTKPRRKGHRCPSAAGLFFSYGKSL
ncbi:hypothetical protein [Calditerricola satsumensis]|uniref:Uncharacterized protein n=1 Tax=Calditerricola satsumensis TaxID=373054 RepID=A0A8J3FCW8_9BACI|nr:hypothetical protein [Calditerricola satsumensis]GGK07522.1 hypothetical protein GCM10007043_21920 [Calditerricola satsumensis]